MNLTKRQLRICKLGSEGLKAKDIGKLMGITEIAVRNQFRLIYDLVGISNRVELALWYIKHYQN